MTGGVLASPASLSSIQGSLWAATSHPRAWPALSLSRVQVGFCSVSMASSSLGTGWPSSPPCVPYPRAHTMYPPAGKAVHGEPPPPPRDALSLWLQKEKLSAQASLKRHTSLNDLSLTRDEQEIEFLRLQVLEQQHVIDDLSLVRLLSAGALGVAPSDTVPGLARRLRAG